MPSIQDILSTMTDKPRLTVSQRPTMNTNCLPDCPVCGGVGWIRPDVPIDDPSFGKLQACPNIDYLKIYGKRNGLDEDQDSLKWENVISRHGTNVLEAVNAIQDTLDAGYGWVFLFGGVGLAKTLLLKIAAAESLRQRKIAAYARMAEVIEHMRRAYDTKDPQEEAERRLDAWSIMPVLCLDEFDRVRNTPFETEKRFVLLDRRYEDAVRRRTVTIFASNADPSSFDDYLFSRINDGRFTVVHMIGDDFRPFMTLSR